MSRTATRWWVRLAARWLARVDGVSGQLRLAMLVLTGLSTATLSLRQYGHGDLAWPLIAMAVGGMAVYTYLYAEGGVWNQVSRDKVDLSTNFAGPTMLIDDTLTGIAVFVAVKGRRPDEAERAEIEAGVRDVWNDYRDGVHLGDD